MNIFALDEDPVLAAEYQIDKHVVKMPLETAQLLCSPYEPGDAPYKRTHYNHPSAVWTRSARDNYLWLVAHGKALCAEYTRRYGRTHASLRVINWADANCYRLEFPVNLMTEFALAMPDEYKCNDPVQAYRAYYLGAKSKFASWKPPAAPPSWWITERT